MFKVNFVWFSWFSRESHLWDPLDNRRFIVMRFKQLFRQFLVVNLVIRRALLSVGILYAIARVPSPWILPDLEWRARLFLLKVVVIVRSLINFSQNFLPNFTIAYLFKLNSLTIYVPLLFLNVCIAMGFISCGCWNLSLSIPILIFIFNRMFSRNRFNSLLRFFSVILLPFITAQ